MAFRLDRIVLRQIQMPLVHFFETSFSRTYQRSIVLVEVISEMPEISASCRSSGVATEVAMISALAPGRSADMPMVGSSTCGNAASGISA